MDVIKVGATRVSFEAGLLLEDKQDIQDCLLYAELLANSGGLKDSRGLRTIKVRC